MIFIKFYILVFASKLTHLDLFKANFQFQYIINFLKILLIRKYFIIFPLKSQSVHLK